MSQEISGNIITSLVSSILTPYSKRTQRLAEKRETVKNSSLPIPSNSNTLLNNSHTIPTNYSLLLSNTGVQTHTQGGRKTWNLRNFEKKTRKTWNFEQKSLKNLEFLKFFTC